MTAPLSKADLRNLSDEELWTRFAEHDDVAAFNVIQARYQPRLVKFAAKVIREEALIEDLVQQAWIRAVNAKDRFDPSRTITTWLHQIMLNLMRNEHRKETRARETPAADHRTANGTEGWVILNARSTDDPEAMMRERELARALDAAVQTLEPEAKRIFLLRASGYSNEEVAAQFGAGVGSIKAKAKRARLRVLEKMRAHL